MVWDQISHDRQRRVFAEPVQYGFKGVRGAREGERVEWETVLPTCLSFYQNLIYFKCVYINSAFNFIPGRHMVSASNNIHRLP